MFTAEIEFLEVPITKGMGQFRQEELLRFPWSVDTRGLESVVCNDTSLTLTSLIRKDGLLQLNQILDIQPNQDNPHRASFRPRHKQRKVINYISGRSVFMKMVKLPPIEEKDIKNMLMFTENDSSPFPLSKAKISAWVMENGNSHKIKTLMTAIKKETLQKNEQVMKQAGLLLSGIVTTPTAIRALIKESRAINTTRPTLFIHLEKNIIGIYIFKDSEPLFTREISFGQAKTTEVDFTKRAGEEVSRSIVYFSNTNRGEIIEQGYIFGSAINEDICDRFCEQTGVDLSIYNPFDDFLDNACDTPKTSGPAIAMAVGAAIDGGSTLDITCQQSFLGKVATGLKTPVIKTVAALLLITIVLYDFTAVTFDRLDDEIKNMEQAIETGQTKLEELAQLQNKLKKLTSKNVKLKQKLKLYPVIDETAYDWFGVFKDVAKSMPKNAALTRWSIDLTSPSNKSVRLMGVIRGTGQKRVSALNGLLEKLASSESFGEVSIVKISKDNKSEAPKSRISFEINAGMAEGSAMFVNRKNIRTDF